MPRFPDFVRNPRNRLALSSQFTDDIEGYLFDGEDGAQVALWTCHADRASKEHAHAFDEYVLVIEGRCTVVVEGQRVELGPGQEFVVPKGARQSMEVTAGTRTLHVFGGRRATRESFLSSSASADDATSPVARAVRTYIQASGERDAATREKLLRACFAERGRFVTRSRVLTGPAQVDAMIARFLADPEVLGFRLTSAVDAAGTTFRYGSRVERRDGTSAEFFDAGEIDADGRIVTLLVFTGPLADVQ
ncbi:MAG: cupin domain-containing protein [Polyangiaceae bacterium]